MKICVNIFTKIKLETVFQKVNVPFIIKVQNFFLLYLNFPILGSNYKTWIHCRIHFQKFGYGSNHPKPLLQDVHFVILDERGDIKGELKAHKLILSLVSEVFEKQFYGPLAESNIQAGSLFSYCTPPPPS